MKTLRGLLAILLFAPFILRAQLVADGAANTLVNVTTNITGTVTVGTNGSFTLLTLADNVLLINSANGVIGQNVTARSNEVRLIRPTARWQPGGTLYVGSNGPFNRLVISNGAQVIGTFPGTTGIIGQTTNSDGNLALVTGAGSVWSNAGPLTVGSFGDNNQLVVSNGARVHTENLCTVGLAISSQNNRVTVSGAGSLWSAGAIHFGLNGVGNRLLVRDGGGVLDVDGFVGSGAGSFNFVDLTGAGTYWTNTGEFHFGDSSQISEMTVSNGAVVFAARLGSIGRASSANVNTVTVTDPGSMWVNAGGLFVGRDGSRNQLLVNNGGAVTATNLFIGIQPTATNNRVVVNGGTLRVTNPAGTSVLEPRRGTNQLVSGLVEADRLVVTNTTGKFELLGGTLVTRGAFINNGSAMNVGESVGGSALWDVRPGLSEHFVNSSVMVGNASSSNQLLVSSGALLTNNGFGNIGFNAGAVGNGATVTGSGSRWHLGNNLLVGSNGESSRLLVSDGGLVNNNSGILGNGASSSNNLALVTGTGSLWTNRFELRVGNVGPGNQLVVSNGARVASLFGNVGDQPGSSNNLVLVTGSGSIWTNHLYLNVGGGSVGNRLIIENGGQVGGEAGTLGSSFNGVGEALVTGPGSLWSSRTEMTVGANGANSLLVVSNGGAVVAGGNGRVGIVTGATNNAVVVTGAGSMWSNQFELYVGEGPRNRLEVNGGGWVVSSNTYVGHFGASNLAMVTGVGSTLSNRADLFVGFANSGNQLMASGGANVFAGGSATIGRDVNARSNSVLIADLGTAWLVATNLFVGSNASFNRLVVSNGATALTGGNASIGENAGASSNSVVTAGPGTRWLVNSDLFAGKSGAFNSLVVSNGAFVSDDSSFVGQNFTASNNLALITGSSSVWSNATQVHVGLFSTDNQLVVSDGATLLSRGGFIGLGGAGNLATVTGPGSRWNAGQTLLIGYEGNRLVISNAASVMNDFGTIGDGPGNTATVFGAGSLWSNRLELTVGNVGSANRLNIQFGGTVFGGKVFVGRGDTSTSNRLVVQNGTLRATNAAGTGVLDVRRGTNVLNSGLVDVDKLVLTNRGTIIPAVFLPATFGNSSSNRIVFGTLPGGYPSTIAVGGLAGSITKVTVIFSNLTFDILPDAFDALLVGPAGQKVMIMSDAGGSDNFTNVTLTFDDFGTLLPDSTAILAGTYHPTDHQPGETMPAPSPAGPYSTNLSSFNGSNPNGVWSLYLLSDTPTIDGSLQGWGVQIYTDVPTIEEKFFDSGVFEQNGGTLITRGAIISNGLPFVVGGPGGVPAVWEARAGLSDNFVARDLLVGNNSSFNQLVIPSGVVAAGTNVIVGASSVSSNNLLHVTGGTLRVLTPGAVLDVRGGTNRIDAGLVDLLHLVVTNTRGQFEMFGGTLRTPDTIIANGRVFTVGGGASLATLQLLGGTHTFDDNLTVTTNGSLIGTGIINGTVTVSPGGRLTPGAPIGSIDLLGSVILQGTVNLQIDKSGGVRTSDEVIADGAIFYNGTLNVTDIGTDVLAAGDKFFLFDATPYVGAFTTLNLPPLGAGLAWKNNLSVDGSIEVVVATQSQPKFSSVVHSGANLILSGTNGTPNSPYAVLTATNVAAPATNWQSLVTNQFGTSGQFSFTNGINPIEPQRYFRLRSP